MKALIRALAALVALGGMVAIGDEFLIMIDSFPVDGVFAVFNFMIETAAAVIVFGAVALLFWLEGETYEKGKK